MVALDIGSKRIGVAVTDPFGTYALPHGTIFRKNLKSDLEAVAALVRERGAAKVVCGLPVHFDGSVSQQTRDTEYFIERLKEAVPVPVVTADERCTTLEAHRVLIEGNMRREKRKQYVDSIAATYILEGYLKKIRSKRSCLKKNWNIAAAATRDANTRTAIAAAKRK